MAGKPGEGAAAVGAAVEGVAQGAGRHALGQSLRGDEGAPRGVGRTGLCLRRRKGGPQDADAGDDRNGEAQPVDSNRAS